MDRRRRAARTVALMSLFSMTDTQENAPIASFDGDGSDLVSLIVGIDPVQTGNGDPSPDNVRPISGWTGAKVTRTGKNLLDVTTFEQGTINADDGAELVSSTRVRSQFIFLAAGSYTVSSTNGFPIVFDVYDENKQFLRSESETNWKSAPHTYSLTNNRFVRIIFKKANDAGITPVELTGEMLELGSTATTYEPYNGNTYSVDWTSEAGTVYGGTLNVTTGKLTVKDGYIASYNGETLPSTWISDRDVYAVGANPTTGAEVVYKLATPIVYDLTPTQVTTLIGTNNIWADTGDIKYIEYNI